MSDNWQHKIENFEIPPSPEAWNKIAEQLDEEYKLPEIMLSQKMHDYEVNPPSFILDNVLTVLNTAQSPKQPARIFTLRVRRMSIAAAVTGLLAITLLYFLRPQSRSSVTESSIVKLTPVLPGKNAVAPKVADNNRFQQYPTQSNTGLLLLNPDLNKKSAYSNNRNSRNGRNVKRANPNPALSANTISPISVTAPPIYDGDGNIIMDETLVSAPDENYIIVTSPNGEQTKISRKFLKMLTVMNGGDPNPFINPESFEWKIRFEEWRRKLLQQAAYIPTAYNFLDIMDLKDMLQEN
jgi:hypothetical protein